MIAIGVPTVVGAAAIVQDTISALLGSFWRKMNAQKAQDRGYARWTQRGSMNYPGASGAGIWADVCDAAGY